MSVCLPACLQPELRAAVMAHFAEMERCAFRLLEAFCLGLGMERTALHHLFQVMSLQLRRGACGMGWQ
jgi:isopenicillin N synthase-like dioxygenase